MKTIQTLLITAAALLSLPSCVQWNIGQRIREAGEIHTGVDILNMEGGLVYLTPQMEKEEKAWVRAPEVTYRKRTSLICADGIGELGSVYDVRPTGQMRTALIDCNAPDVERDGKHAVDGFIALADSIPAGTPSFKAAVTVENMEMYDQWMREASSFYGSLSVTECSRARRLAAAPFDYVVDPALSATHTMLRLPLIILYAPFGLLLGGHGF